MLRKNKKNIKNKKNKKNIMKMEPENNCIICYNIIIPTQNISILNCKHNFHTTCIANWCRHKGQNQITCPSCRDIILEEVTNDQNVLNDQITNQLYLQNAISLESYYHERQLVYLRSVIIKYKKDRYIFIIQCMTITLVLWGLITNNIQSYTSSLISGLEIFLIGFIARNN